MPVRFAFDMGEKSLGWCVLETSAECKKYTVTGLKNAGVRIYESGREEKTGEPLAVQRRMARGIRRNRDRFKRRQTVLLNKLITSGLMPTDEKARKKIETRDPYKLRAKGVRGQLTLYELGRALFHLNQRRGFKSNSKADKADSESGKVKDAIADTDERIDAAGCLTLGEFLHKNDHKRARPTGKTYVLYPSRDMTEHEFSLLWKTQQAFHADILTDEARASIHHVIFHQRPLKPQPRGRCRFEYQQEELRCFRAMPCFQRFRILQEVNNLQFEALYPGCPAESLTPEQRDILYNALLDDAYRLPKTAVLTFNKMKTLIGAKNRVFTLEKSPGIKGLTGDITARRLSDDGVLGAVWPSFSAEKQNNIVNLITGNDKNHESPDFTDEELTRALTEQYGLTDEQAERIMYAPLPEGTANVSRVAIEKMLPALEKGMIYSDAAARIYGMHTASRSNGALATLPYYGALLPESVVPAPKAKDADEKQYGKIHNPTVHIALNQLRKVVNALIAEYGKPDEIVLELARDLKLNREQQRDVEKEIKKNTEHNERIKKEIEDHDLLPGKNPSSADIMRFKLWEDLAEAPLRRCCPFTGKQISIKQIFSADVEVEHLVPFSISFDDSRANKVLAYRQANRLKGNKTPYEMFADKPEEWNDVLARAANLPKNKQRRFLPNARELFSYDMIARQLPDTQYLSRIARRYLGGICNEDNIWSSPGRITALLRRKWRVNLSTLLDGEYGANIKSRDDHRHHAVDAFVIGCTDRGVLQRIATASAKAENSVQADQAFRKKSFLPDEPFPGYRPQLISCIKRIIVSYRPDHKLDTHALYKPDYVSTLSQNTAGSLHEDTYYGILSDDDIKNPAYAFEQSPKKGQSRYIVRKPIEKIEDKELPNILCADLRARAKGAMAEDGLSLKQFFAREDMRHIRLWYDKGDHVMIALKDASGKPYKYVVGGNNFCAEIYEALEGKNAGKWQIEIISMFNAHTKGFIPHWTRPGAPKARFIMRLIKNDMVAYEKAGKTVITRVKKMTSGDVYLRPHIVSEEKGDKLSWQASGLQLQLRHARKVHVDLLGNVHDSRRSA